MEKEKCCETKAKDWWVFEKKKYRWEQMRIQKKYMWLAIRAEKRECTSGDRLYVKPDWSKG